MSKPLSQLSGFRARWRRENVPEAVLVTSIPWRIRWKLYVLHPGWTLKHFTRWFRLACPLLGDHFYSITRDIYAEVYDIDSDTITLEVRAGYIHAQLDADWNRRDPRAPRAFETISLEDFRRRSAWG